MSVSGATMEVPSTTTYGLLWLRFGNRPQSAEPSAFLFSSFREALFLIAVATGHRVSHLAALLRTHQLMRLDRDDSSVTQDPKPLFLAKNESHDDSSITLASKPLFLAKIERAGHRMSPVVVPAWITPAGHHSLCPVASLRAYVSATSSASGPDRWLIPHSSRVLKTSDLASRLVRHLGPGSSRIS